MVGAGAAGLYTALCAARDGGRAYLISATPLAQSSSWWAQGGLAAAMSSDDSPADHLADTIAAGRGAVRESAARVLCEEAPARSRTWPDSACASTPTATARLSLGLEGGHRARRIVHAGGAATGRRIVRQLARWSPRIRGSRSPRDARVVGLVTDDGRCRGVLLDDGSVLAAAAVGAGDRRRGRDVVAHHEPAPARSAAACCSPTRPAPRWPTSS